MLMPRLLRKSRKRFQNLGSDGNIQHGNGFIRDQEFRLQDHGTSDHHALTLPAG